MIVGFGVVLMICVRRFRIFVGSMIVVSRLVSRRSVRCSVSASSVRLMYSALSFLASSCDIVVFPVFGIPVMSMTCFFMCVQISFGVYVVLGRCYDRVCLFLAPYI